MTLKLTGTGTNMDPDDWRDQQVDRDWLAVTATKQKMIAPNYPIIPGHAGTDTSLAAAAAIAPEAESLREQCLHLLQHHDLTADEVAEMLRRSILSIRPRIAELNRKLLVFDSGKRRKNASGNAAIVWTTKKP